MRTKNLLIRIIIAMVISQGFYYFADSFTVSRWNSSESLIVRVISAGPEKIIPSEDEDSYEMAERDTVLELVSGSEPGKQMTLKTVRLSGSGLDIVPGRRYLLVWDMFTDGTVQYSIADAWRVSSVAGVVMLVCTVLIAFTGLRGLFALLGLQLTFPYRYGVPSHAGEFVLDVDVAFLVASYLACPEFRV